MLSRYPAKDKAARKDPRKHATHPNQDIFGRPLPPHPTSFRPGTHGKIAVMRRRLAAGYHLHHPKDAPIDAADVARLPLLHPKNDKLVGWRILDEVQFRRVTDRVRWDDSPFTSRAKGNRRARQISRARRQAIS